MNTSLVLRAALLSALLGSSPASSATSESSIQEGAPAAVSGHANPNFAQCVTLLMDQAEAAGISESTRTQVLATVSHRDDVIRYDRNQPEFVQTFPAYLSKRVTAWRINKGRELLNKHRTLLTQLTREYGVPGHYLIAFWGLETNFGTYKGKMPIIDSLATLACDPRRSSFFTQELMQALRLYDREQLNRQQMVGSWAGAMGHTQFMPSAYLKYAVDGDNDGKVDLWNSEVDALTSAANFLRSLGWKTGYRWGREVMLPATFDYQHAGKQRNKSLSEWQALGLKKADGSALGEVSIPASLLLPSGHRGPAFLVYDNFDVILRWNNSESYAIAVGYLADRIVGKAPLTAALPELSDFAVADIAKLQHALNRMGYDVGQADGIIGPATRSGLRQFQIDFELTADGFPYQEVIDTVRDAARQQGVAWEAPSEQNKG